MKKSFLKLIHRNFHTTRIKHLDVTKVEEVQIPVPWGHVAGRWWGDKGVEPILALHGWSDNAGTWEPLLRLLPDAGVSGEVGGRSTPSSILAIDFPGGGLSSHIPPLHNYYFVDYSYVIELVKRYLGLGQLTLLAHSGGSAASFVYSAIYPEKVRGYFGVDYVLSSYDGHEKRAVALGADLDKAIELGLRKKSNARSYDWEEAKKVWMESTLGSVREDSAKILMKRGVVQMGDGGKVGFVRDDRLKGRRVEVWTAGQVEALAKRITCHVVLVQSLGSPFFEKELRNSPGILEVIKNGAASFVHYKIQGGHHVHMDSPEVVLKLIMDFLGKL